MLKQLYKLPQYSAVETGVPCLALDDMEKLIFDNKQDIKNHLNCGLVFSGYTEDGEIEWIGNDKQWQKYDDISN